MTIEEARRTILDDTASFSAWTTAAGVLTSTDESTLEDLLRCLDRKGLPAEMAATTLYLRTKRPLRDDSPLSIVVDPQNWREYLRKVRPQFR
jgi:hypothetical protein